MQVTVQKDGEKCYQTCDIHDDKESINRIKCTGTETGNAQDKKKLSNNIL